MALTGQQVEPKTETGENGKADVQSGTDGPRAWVLPVVTMLISLVSLAVSVYVIWLVHARDPKAPRAVSWAPTENELYWFFSTAAQTFATAFALVGCVAIYQMRYTRELFWSFAVGVNEWLKDGISLALNMRFSEFFLRKARIVVEEEGNPRRRYALDVMLDRMEQLLQRIQLVRYLVLLDGILVGFVVAFSLTPLLCIHSLVDHPTVCCTFVVLVAFTGVLALVVTATLLYIGLGPVIFKRPNKPAPEKHDPAGPEAGAASESSAD
ncbi:MAG: hypothetical protein ACYS9X_15135 [Planctomycetota bacterium]|jgi:hypothetical protein